MLNVAVVSRAACRRAFPPPRRSGAERTQRILPRTLAAPALRVQLPKASRHISQPPRTVSDSSVVHTLGATLTACAGISALTPPTSACCTFWESNPGLARACAIAMRTTQITPTRKKCARCCFMHPHVSFWSLMVCVGQVFSMVARVRRHVWAGAVGV